MLQRANQREPIVFGWRETAGSQFVIPVEAWMKKNVVAWMKKNATGLGRVAMEGTDVVGGLWAA